MATGHVGTNFIVHNFHELTFQFWRIVQILCSGISELPVSSDHPSCGKEYCHQTFPEQHLPLTRCPGLVMYAVGHITHMQFIRHEIRARDAGTFLLGHSSMNLAYTIYFPVTYVQQDDSLNTFRAYHFFIHTSQPNKFFPLNIEQGWIFLR